MARKISIDALPSDLQEELEQRLLFDWGFTGYREHEAWLAEKGYLVSKSSIHRFGKAIEDSMNNDLRLRCLDIASRYSTSETIIANAKDLLRWIKPPRS